MHFEDQAGEEVVYFHAQKDMQQLIENDQSLHVLGNQHWNVAQDRFTQVTNDDHLTLESDSLNLISKDSMLAVKASHHQKVAKKQLMKVGSEVHLKSKGELVLDAGSEITLSAGGSFLKVDPAGVHLVGAKVNLNSGGGAGSGSACKVKKPEAAVCLDEAILPEEGELIKQAASMEATEGDEVVFEYEAVEIEQSQGTSTVGNGENAQSNDGASGSSDNGGAAGAAAGTASASNESDNETAEDLCPDCNQDNDCGEKIDFDFIKILEGGMELTAYVPDPKGSKSGVTVSVGFDLGARNRQDLINIDLDIELIDKLVPYLGYKKEEAKKFLARNPLKITKEQAEQIYFNNKAKATSRLMTKYNADSDVKFHCIPSQAQTVIASVEYQYGSSKIKTPNFWRQVTNQDWESAYANLMNFRDDYRSRRELEAKMLKEIL
ncbi:pesticin C-terminus-like muramidase [uncultured Shewanella sp.]|uniref:pesticin C-terminus-like muramidase n=1 Tax=uncultured Shewanella sp. TaxID=173975 RepID=UPI00261303E2|nr:pesticin C-terminus-like muramidase [uncultured Shewanella sp.]